MACAAHMLAKWWLQWIFVQHEHTVNLRNCLCSLFSRFRANVSNAQAPRTLCVLRESAHLLGKAGQLPSASLLLFHGASLNDFGNNAILRALRSGDL